MKAILMLADGKSFVGDSLNGKGQALGEVILNTAVVGYQEMITDPANAGKILVLTYPLIGNYGIAPKFNQSDRVWISGLVIREKTRIFSNWQAKRSFDDFIKKEGLVTICGVDTRSLVVHLRQKGQMSGIISTASQDKKELLAKITDFRKSDKESLLPKISVRKPKKLQIKKAKRRIAILDLGITNGIIRQLQTLACVVTILPYNISPREILRLKPHGLIISSGPEEDPGLKDVVINIKALINKLPILGISTGHQVLCRALGAEVTKLRLGHRGVNYPIHNPLSYKGEITVQNHSYVVDSDSLHKVKNIKVTGYNLNDRTVEEFESRKLKLMGVQYYPTSPGFDEVNSALKNFLKMIGRSR